MSSAETMNTGSMQDMGVSPVDNTDHSSDPDVHTAAPLTFTTAPMAVPDIGPVNDTSHLGPHTDTNPEINPPSGRIVLPWWRKPSPWWFLVLVPLLTFTAAAELAPRVAIYTKVICASHKPTGDLEKVGQGSPMWPGGGFFETPLSTTFNEVEDTCQSDPIVQAAVAKLHTVVLTSSGVIGCVTAAWLSSFSDRRGRVWISSIMSVSYIYDDLHFIMVSMFSHLLPGGYWFYVVGAVIVGLTGGGSGGLSGAMYAYISDCTEPHERSRMFSIIVGVNWVGAALGPTVGSLLINRTGSLLSVFFLSLGIRLFVTLSLWFIVPESLSKTAMLEARRLQAERAEEHSLSTPFWLRQAMKMVSPLSVFLPSSSVKNGRSLSKASWSMLVLVISYSMTLPLYGLFEFEIQYLTTVWKWTTEQVGYYLSIIGTTKAIYLSFIFPAITYLFSRPKAAIQLSTEESEPLQPVDATPAEPSETIPTASDRSLSFDLGLARISLLIQLIGFCFIPAAPNSLVYTALSILVCFGAGFSPAIQSAALQIYNRSGGKETGKLFGAISIVQAIGISLFGPALYGLTFMKTVAILPSAIFILSASLIAVSLVFALFIRIPNADNNSNSAEEIAEEVTCA